LNSARRLNGWHLIAAYIPVQAEADKAAMVAAVPGVLETASLAGPCGIIARAQAHDTGELATLVTFRVQAPGGVTPTISCPAVHL